MCNKSLTIAVNIFTFIIDYKWITLRYKLQFICLMTGNFDAVVEYHIEEEYDDMCEADHHSSEPKVKWVG